jgi:hypothetical protein
MYPSIKFVQIERAVNFFLRTAPEEDKEAARKCLEMVKFGMSNCLVQFDGEFWEYGGTIDVEAKGLTIGGYESAFFADLVAAWILENTVELMLDTTFDGIYRDDGILVFDKTKSTDEICDWLEDFQNEINTLTSSEHLQFTVDIWEPSAPLEEKPRLEAVTINRSDYFPYLDMELFWREEKLNFKVHLKENQVLKYLNEGSTHTSACFKSIPHGVLRRLSILTSITPKNQDKRLNELYPEHTRALEQANLPVPQTYPTLRESIETINQRLANSTNPTNDTNKEIQEKKKRDRDRKRSTFFCIGFSRIWGHEPIHVRLKRLRDKHNLTWLRNAMSYHKFSNFGEKFNSDLNSKVNAGLEDISELNLTCVCQKRCKREDGNCAYEGNCRQQMIVYNLHCLCCNKDYVGKSQNHLRIRTDKHYYEVWLAIHKGVYTDSFARQVAKHCSHLTSSNAVRKWCRENIRPSIIYQGDRLKCMKSAMTMNCKMCMVERKEILQRMKADKHKIINDNSDIFARCSCKCRFHKFFRNDSTLRTRLTQKKVPSTRHSKLPRVRQIFTFDHSSISSTECSPCNSEAPTPASSEDAGVFLFDTNVPGLPFRSPTANPSNLELAQVQHYFKYHHLSVGV